VTPGLAAERARVHGKCAAQRPGNAREELGGSETPLHALLGEPRTRDTRLAIDIGVAQALEPIERAVRCDHHASQAAVADQHIAAEPDPMQRCPGGQTVQERGQVVGIARLEEHIGGSAHVPGGVTRHRLVEQHAPGEVRGDGGGVHLCPRTTLTAPSFAGSS
jgi:hypothetical protein